MQRALHRIEGFADLWADACLRNDEGELMFLSFYGRDASAMQFIAAMELGRTEHGITDFTLVSPEGTRNHVQVGSAERLGKFTGRLPRQNLFGSLNHLFVYDKRLQEIDKPNRIGWIVSNVDAGIEEKVWALVKTLAPIALLDHWQAPLIAWCGEKGAVHELGGGLYPRIGNLRAMRVSISDHFIRHVSEGVRNRVLLP
ncbi:hypothetical protein CTR2_R25400 [Comamonas thiooxydans]|uniref:hypothetical protein n=1 Tax=Comamonas thiooxydans TaxID=363952 RepID=UPI000B35A692|nr:hypothetical protein [Comamonas thiooxydans]BDR09202.1 hypothetical protein CTR2_R25400 [Comamonas thiooxydans]